MMRKNLERTHVRSRAVLLWLSANDDCKGMDRSKLRWLVRIAKRALVQLQALQGFIVIIEGYSSALRLVE